MCTVLEQTGAYLKYKEYSTTAQKIKARQLLSLKLLFYCLIQLPLSKMLFVKAYVRGSSL